MKVASPIRASLLAIVVVGLDQLVKVIANGAVTEGEWVNLGLGLRITNTHNEGVAFGMLSDHPVIVMSLVVIALAALLWFFVKHRDRRGLWIATGLLIGGAIGNAIDRVAIGYVRDFIKFPSWPAFNLADIAITFGVIALALTLETGANHEQPTTDSSS